MSEPNRKAELSEQLASGRWTATVHGPKAMRKRFLLSALVGAMTLSALSLVEDQAVSPYDDMRTDIPGGGTVETLDMGLKTLDGEPVSIFNAGGLRPQVIANALTDNVDLSKNEVEDFTQHLVFGMTGPGELDNPAVAATLKNDSICVVYQHPIKTEGLSVFHDYFDQLGKLDPVVHERHRPLSGVVLSPAERAQREQYVFLHEIYHCYFQTLIEHARALKGADRSASDPVIGSLLQQIQETHRSAERLAQEIPGVDAAKLVEIATTQIAEAASDVFGLLAMHQRSTPDELRAHAQQVALGRDLTLVGGSSHDSIDPILALDEHAESVHRYLASHPPALDALPEIDKEGRVRGARFNQKGVHVVSRFALSFVLDHLAEPGMRMRRMQAEEIAASEDGIGNARSDPPDTRPGEQTLDIHAWTASRNAFVNARPSGEALNKIKAQIIAKAQDRDREEPRNDNDTFSFGL